MSSLTEIKKALRKEADPAKAEFFPRFFKNKPGEYGEGDKFLGVTVPKQRAIAKAHKDLALNDTIKLLQSPWHEERLVALFILVQQYQKTDKSGKKLIASAYHKNRAYVNNWDLVDSSAPYILGDYLFKHSRNVLYRLAKSRSVWDRRIAIIATGYFIRQNDFKDTLQIAESLLNDPHDLIHKAVGWMLREVGNRDLAAEETFLKLHASKMPRTMLRYAIEKFPPTKRQAYLAAKAA